MADTATPTIPKPFYRNLTFQVLAAITLGVLMGVLFPAFAVQLEVLGKLFIRLIKMVIAPVIFLTIVLGIGAVGDLKQVGRIGGKALLYFELVTTAALAIGIAVALLVQPGAGVTIPPDLAATAAKSITGMQETHATGWGETLLALVPENVLGAFAEGNILQVLLFSILFAIGLTHLPAQLKTPFLGTLEQWNAAFFRLLEVIMKLAPIGAFGGMAYTIGKFGVGSLLPLMKLMLSVYLTMALFVFGVLGLIAWRYGFKIWDILRLIRAEILLVLGTSSSESALPRLIEKLEKAGCGRKVVGLVIPTGYSFNLDGTSIYLSMACIFLAQVYDIQLGFWQLLGLLGILMLTSKGAAGITGSGFIVLTTTLAAHGTIPVEGVALLLGIDRFMSEARAITNLIGNTIATLVIAKSEGDFIATEFQDELTNPTLQ